MKPARIIVAGIAVAAGIGAMALVGSGSSPPPPQVVEVVAPAPRGPELVDVLVATQTVPVGGTLTPYNMDWRQWPKEAVASYFITRTTRPDAQKQLQGALSRGALQAGEPLNQSRLIQGEHGGLMSALLPEGMRAISVPISPETGAGGFILPNDRVDVLLTRREKGSSNDSVVSQIILSNIRVLAIDQTIQERDGEKVVVGRTATLELQPAQTETIALAKQLGEIALALRSLAEAPKSISEPVKPNDLQQRSGAMTIVRFGVPVQVPSFGR